MLERSEYDLLRAQTSHKNAMAPLPQIFRLTLHYCGGVIFYQEQHNTYVRDTGVILNLSASIGGVIYYLERTK